MNSPASTYRVQLSCSFTLWNLENIVEYLEELGVGGIYAAPFFQARKGSTHGYDVADPSHINREIGTIESFREMGKSLKYKRMKWLQDIVPNHMAFHGENVWMRDLFQLGPDSQYYRSFDVDWEKKDQKRLMAPFLGASLEKVLEDKDLKIDFDEKGFSINYYDNSYPASARSYAEILEGSGWDKWKEKFRNFSGGTKEWQKLKNAFQWEVSGHYENLKNLQKKISDISEDPDRMKKILKLQYFAPVYWKNTEKEINYRRFFTINDLICLKMEDQEVFDTYHSFVHELFEEGLIDGLRIDHIDGLFDPKSYLERVRDLLGSGLYLIAEKILEGEENLPTDWPVQGTSGYEFLAQVNQLFTDSRGRKKFDNFYQKLAPEFADYHQLVYDKKLFILKKRMGGELQNLWLLLNDLELLPKEGEQEEQVWKEALAAFMAAFPVYRIYPKRFPLKKEEQKVIETAFEMAGEQQQDRMDELEYLKALALGQPDKDQEKMLFFLQRCQQFTGPLAAKGVEDTTFYIYNRLISHNEVGDSPGQFGSNGEKFHRQMKWRKEHFPLSINASATHDTKRGEDARMRLNVLSELPDEWFKKVKEWQEINNKVRNNGNIPDKNEEYFIYQCILGALPFNGKTEKRFFLRTRQYLQKVLREAKVHSNWAQPDHGYEEEVFGFIDDILNNEEFRQSFDAFSKKIAYYGVIKSLGQSLLKIAAPGIPDIYQGSELWDLSYVDPDNRRPVDYTKREEYLSSFRRMKKEEKGKQLKEFRRNYGNGKLKMYSLHKALMERRENQGLFEHGEYQPLKISGRKDEEFLAFARHNEKQWYVVVIPVLVTEIFEEKEFKPFEKVMQNHWLSLPKGAPVKWENVFTGEKLKAEDSFLLKDLFKEFPVAFLKAQRN
ncbi:MAG: malto-oligosyltrehalose synthase [Salegentibacter sp.]